MNWVPPQTIGATISRNWPVSQVQRAVLLALLGNLALVVSAKVQIPFWPVPLTLQTLVVLALPLVLGRNLGVAAVSAYLLEGIAGLPVFAGAQAGLLYVVGPTGGYLAGFFVAAWVLWEIMNQFNVRSVPKALVLMLVGNGLIYALGTTWLSQFIGWGRVLEVGVLPFLAGDAVKIAVGALALPYLWKRLG